MIGLFSFALPVMAATTASLSPASVTVATGKSFTVSIVVNPQGVNNFAEKLEVDFPASELEVTSFSLGSNWMALTQPSYDSTDNTNGVLIKTAGYPAGFSGVTTFGTITFTAKKSGSGTIKIGNSSLAFEANSQSAITGSGTAFTVSASAVAPTTAPASKTTEQVTPTAQTQPVAQQATNTASTQVAAVATAGSQSYTWLLILLIVVLLVVIGWLLYSRKSKRRF